MRALVLIALLLSTLIPVWACSCGPLTEPPCQAAWNYSAVFTGTVVTVTDPAAPPPPPQTAGSPPARLMYYPSTTPVFSSRNRVVRVQIAEVLNGIEPGQKEIEILTGMGGGDCGYSFAAGVDYIIYAYKNSEGRLETGICSRTRPLDQAVEDLAYLHAMPQLPATADIRISVTDSSSLQAFRAMSKVRTTISGPDLREALTDSRGKAAFAGLTPGEYKLHWASDGYKSGDRKIQVHAKGCAEVPVYMMLDRRLHGRVLTRAGLPAAKVMVEMVLANPGPNEASAARNYATTDLDGNYEFESLRTGDFYLGVNLDHPASVESPYARWFFPGIEDSVGATIIHLPAAPDEQTFDLILPEPQKDRIIEGTVVWPDGRPARARLPLEDPRWPGYASSGSSDGDGHFLLHSFDGTRYRLHAVGGQSSDSAVSAEPVDIQPGNTPLKLRLILTRPGDSFQQEREEQHRK